MREMALEFYPETDGLFIESSDYAICHCAECEPKFFDHEFAFVRSKPLDSPRDATRRQLTRQLTAAHRKADRRRIDGTPICCQSDGMTRTQIQLPDDTFVRAKKLCQAREISLAELARRGIEYILSVYSTEQEAKKEWHPPTPRKLGWRGLSDAEIKREAQLTTSELSLIKRSKR